MTEDEMVGWHHQLSGHEFEQTPGDSEEQRRLACSSPWGQKEWYTTKRLNNSKNRGSSIFLRQTGWESQGPLKSNSCLESLLTPSFRETYMSLTELETQKCGGETHFRGLPGGLTQQCQGQATLLTKSSSPSHHQFL